MSKYDDIINLPHHVSKTRKPISLAARAAQFAPFAALSGHEDAIEETARPTSAFVEMADEERVEIYRKVMDSFHSSARITMTYFLPDRVKSGGMYLTVTGVIKRVTEESGVITMDDGTNIFAKYISKVSTDE